MTNDLVHLISLRCNLISHYLNVLYVKRLRSRTREIEHNNSCYSWLKFLGNCFEPYMCYVLYFSLSFKGLICILINLYDFMSGYVLTIFFVELC